MNDYDRIANLVRHLDSHHLEQPDLATLARHAGLSPSAFHRLFSAWVGATPKDFLQCLTLEHAKASLREGRSVLDAAFDVGLSGGGRLHDLCVGLEAASPGEMKSGGAGWSLVAGYAPSPFGHVLVAEGPRGICHLAFAEPERFDGAWSELRAQWPEAEIRRDDRLADRLAGSIFRLPERHDARPRLRAFVRGTAFQVRVWRALLNIPLGTVTSYGDLATLLGNADSARAVGSAVARNPLAYLIPCHRVIRETGIVSGYRWGIPRKRAMLAWEHASRLGSNKSNIADAA